MSYRHVGPWPTRQLRNLCKTACFPVAFIQPLRLMHQKELVSINMENMPWHITVASVWSECALADSPLNIWLAFNWKWHHAVRYNLWTDQISRDWQWEKNILLWEKRLNSTVILQERKWDASSQPATHMYRSKTLEWLYSVQHNTAYTLSNIIWTNWDFWPISFLQREM